MNNVTFEIAPTPAKIKFGVKEIGGKTTILEKVVIVDLVPFNEWNIALHHYFQRREYKWNIPSVAYYCHIDNLGYFVGVDEVKIKRVV